MAQKDLTIIDTIQKLTILFYVNKKYAVNDIRLLRLKADEDGEFCDIPSLLTYFKGYASELVDICKNHYNEKIKKLSKNQQVKFNVITLASWLSGSPSLIKPDPEAKIPSDFLIPISNGTVFLNSKNKKDYVRILDVTRPFKPGQVATHNFTYSVGLVECTESDRNYITMPLNSEFVKYIDEVSVVPTAGNIYGVGNSDQFVNKEIEFLDKKYPVNSYVNFCIDSRFSAQFEGLPALKITRFRPPTDCGGQATFAKVTNVKNQSGVSVQSLIPPTSGNTGYSEAKIQLFVIGGPHDGQKVTRSSFEIQPAVPKILESIKTVIEGIIDVTFMESSLSYYLNDAGLVELSEQIINDGYVSCGIGSLDIFEDIINGTNKVLKHLLYESGQENKLWMYRKDLKIAHEMIQSGVEPEDTEFYFILHDSEFKIEFPEESGLEVLMTLSYEPLLSEDSYISINFDNQLQQANVKNYEISEFKNKLDIYSIFITNYLGSRAMPGTVEAGWLTRFIPLPIHSLSFVHNKKYLENRINKLKANLSNIRNIHDYNKIVIEKWFGKEGPAKQTVKQIIKPKIEVLGYWNSKIIQKQIEAGDVVNVSLVPFRCIDCGPTSKVNDMLTPDMGDIKNFLKQKCESCKWALEDALNSTVKTKAEKLDELTYSLVLKDFPPINKLPIIAEVRKITGMSLKDSKDFVENIPAVIKKYVSKEEAGKARDSLEVVGGIVEIYAGKIPDSALTYLPGTQIEKNKIIGWHFPSADFDEVICVKCYNSGKADVFKNKLKPILSGNPEAPTYLKFECIVCNNLVNQALTTENTMKALLSDDTLAWFDPVYNQYYCIEESFGKALEPVNLKSFITGRNCAACGKNILGVWKNHQEEPESGLDALL